MAAEAAPARLMCGFWDCRQICTSSTIFETFSSPPAGGQAQGDVGAFRVHGDRLQLGARARTSNPCSSGLEGLES
ncbi:hypothetical protein C7K08_06980 [Synechococcus lacustris str. Tous]|uniref:Uncharacterized protein n=1 Tax=Synechococcus lacustris str. Tous TaxID=1910958 RepID=A0A2P7EEH6_9SYNE|nr:hypothetical protein C7K08_06980 [Synechococcus lacustris str. Tous]